MINDDATLVIGSGNYFTAPTGTEFPADLLAPTSPWGNVGHTSLEDIFAISSEGGEATMLGTLQNKSLRSAYGITNPAAPDPEMPTAAADPAHSGTLYAHLADVHTGWTEAP